MKIINKIQIDNSDLPQASSKRVFSVFGDEGAVFSLYIIRNSNKQYYDFSVGTFTGVNQRKGLFQEKITNSGVFTGNIVFPTSTDDSYNLYLEAELAYNTELSTSLVSQGFLYQLPNFDNTVNVNNVLTYPSSIHQFTNKSLVVKFRHNDSDVVESNSGSLGTINMITGSTSTLTFSQSVSMANADHNVTIIRQPKSTDFYTEIQKTVDGAISSSTTVVLDDVNSLVTGLVLQTTSGGTIPGTKPTITNINTVTKTLTLSAACSLDNNATLTFRAYGSSKTNAISGFTFKTSNLAVALPAVGPANDFNVETKTNGAWNSGTTITLDSTAGIKAGNTIFAVGLGIDASGNDITVSSVTNSTQIVASAAHASVYSIADNVKIFFAGSAATATVTGTITLNSFKKTAAASTDLFLDLNKVFTITDSY